MFIFISMCLHEGRKTVPFSVCVCVREHAQDLVRFIVNGEILESLCE